VGKAARAWG